MSEKSAVRADTSASRGNARELVSDIDVLLSPKTVARIDDIIEVAGFKFRISRVCMRHNLQGRLDHFQIGGTFWSAE